MTHEPDDGPKLFSAQQLDAILRSSGRMIYYGAGLRSDGRETSCKLLCLQAARGNLLTMSTSGASLRGEPSRE